MSAPDLQDYPLVSIGIPNYNGSKYIIETLESIKAQTYCNIEIFIVDDASTDDSVRIVEEWIQNNKHFTVTLLQHKENKGPCQACNTFFKECNGKYFQYVGSDDILDPDKILKQVKILSGLANDYAFVYSDTRLIDAYGSEVHVSYLENLNFKKESMPQGEILEELLKFNFVASCSPLVLTEAAKAVGGFNTNYWVEDYDLWLRLAYKYKVAYMPETTAAYRVHTTSLTNNKSTWAKTIDEALHMRYQFYAEASEEVQQNIKNIIRHDAAALYAYNYHTAGYWLEKSIQFDFHFKSLILLMFYKAGVSFSTISALKAKFKGMLSFR